MSSLYLHHLALLDDHHQYRRLVQWYLGSNIYDNIHSHSKLKFISDLWDRIEQSSNYDATKIEQKVDEVVSKPPNA